jgi:hypothetical protein
MNRFATLLALSYFSLVLGPIPDAASQIPQSSNSSEKLHEIVSVLRAVWRSDFEINYQKYMLGRSPVVVLIPRSEMIRIADARLDGRRRDGTATQGLTMGEKPDVKIVVVYDDIAPLLVANAIVHEIAHLQLRDAKLPRTLEEAHIRKTVDMAFFEKAFGRKWMETTAAALKKKVASVKQGGRLYWGYTPESVDEFYEQIRKAGVIIDKSPLHDRILSTLVFIFTNSEKDLSAALDASDELN